MTPEEKIYSVLDHIGRERKISPNPNLIEFKFNDHVVGAGIVTSDDERKILLKLEKENIIKLHFSSINSEIYRMLEPDISKRKNIQIEALSKFEGEYMRYRNFINGTAKTNFNSKNITRKYRFEKFEFRAFLEFIWDLINCFQISQIRFSPHQGVSLFNEHQLTHIGPNFDLNNVGDFLYIWSRNEKVVRVVTFEQFHKNGTPKIKMTFDLDKKNLIIESVEGITSEDIEVSLKKFFSIEEVSFNSDGVSKWWKYTHPIWWILQITHLPFFLVKKVGFDISRIEKSFFGSIIRLIIGSVLVFGGGVLPILDAFGYKDKFVIFVKGIFGL